MNKKKLSVVMAGAMLATSVAPVLAAPVEYGTSQKKLVEKEVMDLVNSKKISTNATIKGADGNKDTDYVLKGVAEIMQISETTPESAYGVKIVDKDGKETRSLTYKIAEIETALKASKASDIITVYERSTSTFLGEIIPGTEIKSLGVAENNKFKSADFVSLNALDTALDGLTLTASDKDKDSITTAVSGTGSGYIESVKLNDARTSATITLKSLKNLANEDEGHRTIELTVGSPKLNFDLAVDSEGEDAKLLTNPSVDVMNCVGFKSKETYQPSAKIVEEAKVVKEYKLVDDTAKEEKVTYLASDLYDGFTLTAKGTEIKTDILNATKVAEETEKNATVVLGANTGLNLSGDGVADFTITYYTSHKDNPTKPAKVVTVKSTNVKEITSLYNMLKEKVTFRVGIVGGQNRYETAVNVAKAQGITEITAGKAANKDNNDIVLVNGESLVDGLAAAPLAASLKWNAQATGTAVLLSKTDSLPKETKDYLESLLVNVSNSKIKNVKIHLVGGESVLSESLVEELKDMGFSVERYGGDNREETSLEVAEAIDKTAGKGAYIVGGNGEADAMSIAAVAADEKTPIIVSSVHGLTKDALKYVKARKDNTMTIVGGESVVSAEEYAKLDELTSDTNAVKRVAGKNRFETNAKVIEEFYKKGGLVEDVNGVVMVKDGVAKELDLVDALSAANYAAVMKAPIVLASTSLNDNQKNALLNMDLANDDIKATGTVAQVGIGAERTVLETIAGLFGISNVK